MLKKKKEKKVEGTCSSNSWFTDLIPLARHANKARGCLFCCYSGIDHKIKSLSLTQVAALCLVNVFFVNKQFDMLACATYIGLLQLTINRYCNPFQNVNPEFC